MTSAAHVSSQRASAARKIELDDELLGGRVASLGDAAASATTTPSGEITRLAPSSVPDGVRAALVDADPPLPVGEGVGRIQHVHHRSAATS